MSSEEIIQSWMNKIKLADDSRKAIIQKLNSVGQEIPTDEQLIEQGLDPVRFHEIENYLQPYVDSFIAYYPTGPLTYDNISAYLSSLDVIRDELIQQLQDFSLWDGYPKDICKISEISAHIIYDSYLITFDSCGGDPVQPIHIRKGSPLGTLPQAIYDEHVFLGWFTAAEGGTQVNSSTIPTSDTTYYAQYMNSYITLQKVGSVQVDSDLIASNFSTVNFLTSIASDKLNFTDGLELVFRAKTTNPAVNQEIFGMTDAEAFEFGTTDNKFMWEIASGSASTVGSNTCIADHWYYWKVVKAVGEFSYECYIADGTTLTDTPNWSLDYGPVTRSATVNGCIAVGIDYWGGSSTTHVEPWLGQIDLKNSYIKVNGKKALFRVQ